jgi:hypothetical protein
MPEWVHVWFWLRFLREPQMMTPLPQQEDDPDKMSDGEYEQLRNEWRRVGAPLTSTKKLLAAMGASGTDDIPF